MNMSSIKRRRVIKSCRYCYEHKLKCNKGTPCDNCMRLMLTEQCVYGFNKDSTQVMRKEIPPRKGDVKLAHTKRTVFKTKNYYPFFSNSINERVLAASNDDRDYLSKRKLKRNEITKFKKHEAEIMTMNDILSLIPAQKKSMDLILDVYFQSVDPIIPIVNQEDLKDTVRTVYNDLQEKSIAELPQITLLFTILFSVAFSNVAKGEIPDVLLCRKYYSAFESLLRMIQFPSKPNIETLQGVVIVNFVIDPNMVESLGQSAMLLRIAQQLGLHKKCFYQFSGRNSTSLKVFWHYMLYIEGSSSVVAGLPFLGTKNMYQSVDLAPVNDSLHGSYLAFANGRFIINNFFRIIMHLSDSDKSPNKKTLKGIEYQLSNLYEQVKRLCDVIKRNNDKEGEYLASTLCIFLLRAHLRFRALFSLNHRTDQLIQTAESGSEVKTVNVEEILESKQSLDKTTIELSLVLLFYTLKRLIEHNCSNFDWYSRGSTVMQYLFVVIKDIFQFPKNSFAPTQLLSDLKAATSKDIIECMEVDPVFCKFILIDELMKVLEIKLAPLWGEDELYKFFLVRSVKEKVWEVYQDFMELNMGNLEVLRKCKLFRAERLHIDAIESVNLDEFMKQWELDKTQFNMEKVLMNWLSEF